MKTAAIHIVGLPGRLSQTNHKQIVLSMKFYPLKRIKKTFFVCFFLLLCSPKITILYFLNKLDMSDVVSPIVVVAARVELPERLCPCPYILILFLFYFKKLGPGLSKEYFLVIRAIVRAVIRTMTLTTHCQQNNRGTMSSQELNNFLY